MFRRAFFAVMLVFLLIGLFSFGFNVQRVNGATIVVPDDYSTIEAAVSHANSGDTISVRNGTYDEELALAVNLTVVGVSRFDTVVERLNVSGFVDVYLSNVCVNHLDVNDSAKVWAFGCRFPEAVVNSSAKLLLCQSEAWDVHVYDDGEILGFYDLPFFGRVVFSFPFGFILLVLPVFLVLVVVAVLLLVYVRRKQKKQVKAKE